MGLDSLLFSLFLGKPLWMWALFLGLVAALLAFDLGVLRRKTREIKAGESLLLSGGYILMGLAFGVWVWMSLGAGPGMEYFTGFALEKTLALDNVFVIAMIFAYFGVPPHLQHRVLFWGVLGVIVMRAIMIGLGATLVASFGWVLYIFAAFLILTGVKMLTASGKAHDVGASPVLAWLRRRVPSTDGLRGERFFVREPDASGRMRLLATPLFMALVMIEIADLVFAVDSVPAIFAVTTDPYIVYTSNIFAILGLRALYFALAAMIERFHSLKYALALVLIFIGSKIFVADMMGLAKIPPVLSLGVTLGLLLGGVIVSLIRARPAKAAPSP